MKPLHHGLRHEPCSAADIAAAAAAALDPCTREYRELRRQLWAEGAFEPRASFYALKQVRVRVRARVRVKVRVRVRVRVRGSG